MVNFQELIFGFLEDEFEDSSEISSYSSSLGFDDGENVDEENDENISFNIEHSNKAFWESQEDLLKVILSDEAFYFLFFNFLRFLGKIKKFKEVFILAIFFL